MDPIPLLAQGDGFIVVSKPPRVVVHRGRDTRDEYAALQRARDLAGCRVFPIHRLDRQASGCLLFATRRERAGELHLALKKGTKTYVCLTRGWFKHEWPLTIDKPITSEGRTKEAESLVECLGRSHDPRCSLVRVRPVTGRNHQVRRHVRDLHHPIIGDRDHGDHRENRVWREQRGMARLALHALALDLELPEGRLQVHSPLWDDMHAVLTTMPWWDEAVEQQPELASDPLRVADYIQTEAYEGPASPESPAENDAGA
ncbi:MAG: hypothetical protein GY913_34495 [Proteobacteria bacterium]|nr:hypothetical protein [Pseudomonadota bacterium]MCP4922040.1 hypothetical protein [Pseudomonadota bacterium]